MDSIHDILQLAFYSPVGSSLVKSLSTIFAKALVITIGLYPNASSWSSPPLNKGLISDVVQLDGQWLVLIVTFIIYLITGAVNLIPSTMST